jgi:hypothetical protein
VHAARTRGGPGRGRFARPWSCELACAATRVSDTDSSRLFDLAREVFLAAAAGNPSSANASTAELSRSFHDSIAAVQTFIALSQDAALPACRSVASV